METSVINMDFVAQIVQLPYTQLWIDYDEEADVLYVSFRKPQCADDSIMEEDGNIYHYRGEELVGITLMNAKKRALQSAKA